MNFALLNEFIHGLISIVSRKNRNNSQFFIYISFYWTKEKRTKTKKDGARDVTTRYIVYFMTGRFRRMCVENFHLKAICGMRYDIAPCGGVCIQYLFPSLSLSAYIHVFSQCYMLTRTNKFDFVVFLDISSLRSICLASFNRV